MWTLILILLAVGAAGPLCMEAVVLLFSVFWHVIYGIVFSVCYLVQAVKWVLGPRAPGDEAPADRPAPVAPPSPVDPPPARRAQQPRARPPLYCHWKVKEMKEEEERKRRALGRR
jgi:hypothetical protein